MENQKPDLSGLRIRRSQDQEPPEAGGRPKRRFFLFVGIVVDLAPLVYLVVTSAFFDQAVTVQLATATLSSPSQADTVLTASGCLIDLAQHTLQVFARDLAEAVAYARNPPQAMPRSAGIYGGGGVALGDPAAIEAFFLQVMDALTDGPA